MFVLIVWANFRNVVYSYCDTDMHLMNYRTILTAGRKKDRMLHMVFTNVNPEF